MNNLIMAKEAREIIESEDVLKKYKHRITQEITKKCQNGNCGIDILVNEKHAIDILKWLAYHGYQAAIKESYKKSMETIEISW